MAAVALKIPRACQLVQIAEFIGCEPRNDRGSSQDEDTKQDQEPEHEHEHEVGDNQGQDLRGSDVLYSVRGKPGSQGKMGEINGRVGW
jgi:hypothetical protein